MTNKPNRAETDADYYDVMALDIMSVLPYPPSDLMEFMVEKGYAKDATRKRVMFYLQNNVLCLDDNLWIAKPRD